MQAKPKPPFKTAAQRKAWEDSLSPEVRAIYEQSFVTAKIFKRIESLEKGKKAA